MNLPGDFATRDAEITSRYLVRMRYAAGAAVRTAYHAFRWLAGRQDAVSVIRLLQRWALRTGRVRRLTGDRPVWIVLNGGEVTQVVTFTKLLQEAMSPVPVVLVTSNTYAADFASRHLPSLADTIETPLDLEPVCRRALRQAMPRGLIFIENVYVPVLARTARALGIPTILASGLVQLRFREHPLYLRPFRLGVYGHIDLHVVKSERDARTLTTDLGVPAERVRVGGNLKFDASFLSQSTRVTTLTRDSLGPDWVASFVLLAGSIHRPEDELVGETVRSLRARGHEVKLIVAPRYPAEADRVARGLEERGISTMRRSRLRGDGPVAETALIIDTFGELPALYPLADTVILGGSFSRRWKVGFGQNIIEPLFA